MEFFTLASGSSGNAALLRTEHAAVLLDAGISAKRLTQALEALGTPPEALDAILITHEHADHIAGLRVFCKKHAVPVYASRGTAEALRDLAPTAQVVAFDAPGSFSLFDLTVTAFCSSHDAFAPVGFRLDAPDGSLGLLTDTGLVPDEARDILRGADTLVLEANHDLGLLESGPYPYPLKRRIAGERGHLSNVDAAEFAVWAAQNGTQTIVLAHLSKENNTPELACLTVMHRLQRAHCEVELSVAPRSGVCEVAICKRSPCFASES